jgi:hypothetical protein
MAKGYPGGFDALTDDVLHANKMMETVIEKMTAPSTTEEVWDSYLDIAMVEEKRYHYLCSLCHKLYNFDPRVVT